MTSPQSSGVSRRQFLRRTVAAAALPMIVPGSVLGLRGAVAPSNRIGFGIIGFGNRARGTLPTFMSFPEIQYVAVSDCREDRRKAGKEMVDNRYGNHDCKEYEDFRELLARKDVDAVSIATGTRWHGIASMYAARAGKDIYCEKPVSLTIAEGRALVNTCRAFGTVYQAGTQRRSTASYRFAVEMVRQGRIGRLQAAIGGEEAFGIFGREGRQLSAAPLIVHCYPSGRVHPERGECSRNRGGRRTAPSVGHGYRMKYPSRPRQ